MGAADKTIPAIELDSDLSATMLRYLRLQEQRQQVETRVKTLDTEMQQLKGQMVAKLNGSCMAMGEYGGTQYTISYNPVSRTGITKDNLQKLKLLHPDIYDEYVTVSDFERRFDELKNSPDAKDFLNAKLEERKERLRKTCSLDIRRSRNLPP